MSPTPTPRTARGRTGIAAEAVARGHLVALGWAIVAANVVVGHGELDLVALDPDAPGTLVVVEVRGARTTRFGAPEESVDARKLARLRSTVWGLLRSDWLADHGLPRPRMVRIDVIAVELDAGASPAGHAVRHLRGITDP
jgi:putative endonuclease